MGNETRPQDTGAAPSSWLGSLSRGAPGALSRPGAADAVEAVLARFGYGPEAFEAAGRAARAVADTSAIDELTALEDNLDELSMWRVALNADGDLASIAAGVAGMLEDTVRSQTGFFWTLIRADASSDWNRIRRLAAQTDDLCAAALASARHLVQVAAKASTGPAPA